MKLSSVIILLVYFLLAINPLNAESFCNFEFSLNHNLNEVTLPQFQVTDSGFSFIQTKNQEIKFDPVDLDLAKRILANEWVESERFKLQLEQIHQIGSGEIGKNGNLAEKGNFTFRQLFHKYKESRNLGITPVKVRALMKAGVLGGKNRKKTSKKKKKNQKKIKKVKKVAESNQANSRYVFGDDLSDPMQNLEHLQTYFNNHFKLRFSRLNNSIIVLLLEKYFVKNERAGFLLADISHGVIQSIIDEVYLIAKPEIDKGNKQYGNALFDDGKAVGFLNYVSDLIIDQVFTRADEIYYAGSHSKTTEKIESDFKKLLSSAKSDQQKAHAYFQYTQSFEGNIHMLDWNIVSSAFDFFSPAQTASFVGSFLSQLSSMRNTYDLSVLNHRFYLLINLLLKSSAPVFGQYIGCFSAAIEQKLKTLGMVPDYEVHYNEKLDLIGVNKTKLIMDVFGDVTKQKTEADYEVFEKAILAIDITELYEFYFLRYLLQLTDFSVSEQKSLYTKLENKNSVFKYLLMEKSLSYALANMNLVERSLFQGSGLRYSSSLVSFENIISALDQSDLSKLLSPHVIKQLIRKDFKSLPARIQSYLIRVGELNDLIHLFAGLDFSDLKKNQYISTLVKELTKKISKFDDFVEVDLSQSESDFMQLTLSHQNQDIVKLALMILLSQPSDDAVEGLVLILENNEYFHEPYIQAVFLGTINGMSGGSASIWLNSLFNTPKYRILKPYLYTKLSDLQKAGLIWREAIRDEAFNQENQKEIKQSDLIRKSVNHMLASSSFAGRVIKISLSLDEAGLLDDSETKKQLKTYRQERKDGKKAAYAAAKNKAPSKKDSFIEDTTIDDITSNLDTKRSLVDFIKKPSSFKLEEAISLLKGSMNDSTIASQDYVIISLTALLDLGLAKHPLEKRLSFLDDVLYAIQLQTKESVLLKYFRWLSQYALHLNQELLDEPEVEKLTLLFGSLFLKSSNPSNYLTYFMAMLEHPHFVIREYVLSKLDIFFKDQSVSTIPSKKFITKIQSAFDHFNRCKNQKIKGVLASFLLGFSGTKHEDLSAAVLELDSLELYDNVKQAVSQKVEDSQSIILSEMTTQSISNKSEWSQIKDDLSPDQMGGSYLEIFYNFFETETNAVDKLNRLLEAVSMETTFHYERQLGRTPIDMSQTHAGYDVWSIDFRTGDIRFIEVKAKLQKSKHFEKIYISNHELEVSLQSQQEKMGQYIFYVTDINARSGEVEITPLINVDFSPYDSRAMILDTDTYSNAAYSRKKLMEYKVPAQSEVD